MEYYNTYSGTNVPWRWGQQVLPKCWFYLPGDKTRHSKLSYLYTHCNEKLRLTRSKIVSGNFLSTLPPFARHLSRLHFQNHCFWRNSALIRAKLWQLRRYDWATYCMKDESWFDSQQVHEITLFFKAFRKARGWGWAITFLGNAYCEFFPWG